MSLEKAWSQRAPLFSTLEAVRIFHGPSEGVGEFSRLAIERFQDHYWIFEWESGEEPSREADTAPMTDALQEVKRFLSGKGAQSIVYLSRPRGKTPDEGPVVLMGEPPAFLDVRENELRFRIRFQKTRHPGLFLDHEPLRRWLVSDLKKFFSKESFKS